MGKVGRLGRMCSVPRGLIPNPRPAPGRPWMSTQGWASGRQIEVPCQQEQSFTIGKMSFDMSPLWTRELQRLVWPSKSKRHKPSTVRAVPPDQATITSHDEPEFRLTPNTWPEASELQ